MSTHWFHDHMLDFTAQNVYKGNAAMMNYYSSIDRGNEAINDGVNLRFPSGSSLGWGNRDYDINLVVAGKAWDDEGQLWYKLFQTDGMIEDRLLTNWQYNPYLDVRVASTASDPERSVARYLSQLVVERQGNAGVPGPLARVSTTRSVPHDRDDALVEHVVNFDGTNGTGAGLPTHAIGERYDTWSTSAVPAGGQPVLRQPDGATTVVPTARQPAQRPERLVQGGRGRRRWRRPPIEGGDLVLPFLQLRVQEMLPAWSTSRPT